jgi:hypothetical protein
MLKYIALTLFIIASILAWMVYGIGTSKIYSETLEVRVSPHVYQNKNHTIKDINVFAFYFVPKDKIESSYAGWHDAIKKELGALEDFHSLQFQNKSSIHTSIYPQPILGLQESVVYDTEVTKNGNPKALINVSEEIQDRIFSPNGDLYNLEMSEKANEDTYSALFILYEGVGASGGIVHESDLKTTDEIAKELGIPESVIFIVDVKFADGLFLLNRDFLSGIPGIFGETLLAHEFYHVIGVPDSYKTPDGNPTTQDVMGSGRFKPLDRTYLSKDTLGKLGI